MYTKDVYIKFKEHLNLNPIQMEYVKYKIPTSDVTSFKLTKVWGNDFENTFFIFVINCK